MRAEINREEERKMRSTQWRDAEKNDTEEY